MNATLHLDGSDEPRAEVIKDSVGVEFLFIGPGSGPGGLYVELTHELVQSLKKIVWSYELRETLREHQPGPSLKVGDQLVTPEGEQVEIEVVGSPTKWTDPLITHVGAAGSVVTTRGYNREAELLDPPVDPWDR